MMIDKIFKILIQALPILLMIALIPLIENDYYLFLGYIIIIIVSFFIYYEKKDYILFIFGLIAMIIAEYIFISTGVEIFLRSSLFGVMPIWLPLLWAYAFVVIKHSIQILK